jgi:PIN domain nuclease of toxin-antitoxin system
MRILLDTQVFIWLINNDSRLGSKSKEIVSSTKNQVYISFLSFFEIAIKASLGKLVFNITIMNDLEKIGVELIPGGQQSLQTYRVFNKNNKDPFDNFLIATAKSHKLILLSSDHKVLATKLSGLEVFDATK